jgi:CBS domain-containing protein
MQLRDVMTAEVDGIRSSDSFATAARKMAELDVGSLPVLDGGKLVGVVTDRDIVVRGLAKGAGGDTGIAAAMTREVVTCPPETDTHAAATLMGDKQIRRLYVCDGDKLVGVVALGDLAVETRGADAGAALKEISKP